jgi:hypothetical protein
LAWQLVHEAMRPKDEKNSNLGVSALQSLPTAVLKRGQAGLGRLVVGKLLHDLPRGQGSKRGW